MNFVDKVAVVPGGTGTLGWLIVQQLLHGSARVVIVSRDEARFEQRLKTVPNMKAHLEFRRADLRRADDVERLVDAVHDAHGRVDLLIHAAGTPPGPPRAIVETTADEFEDTWSANVTTAFLVTRALLASARAEDLLRIVHIGTRLGNYVDRPPLHGHVACRNAVACLAEGVAHERGGGREVVCNLVCPALLDTRANRQAFPDLDDALWSKPGDVARSAALLVSEETAGLNGTSLPV